MPPACEIELLDRSGKAVGYALVYPQDYERLHRRVWRLSSHGYAVRGQVLNGRRQTIYMHRELMNPPPGLVVDHINGNQLDNRRSNLRIVSIAENNSNSERRRNRVGYRGVYPHGKSGRYVAQISVGGRLQSLGLFDSPEVAARAYDTAALKVRGGFARLNFPSA